MALPTPSPAMMLLSKRQAKKNLTDSGDRTELRAKGHGPLFWDYPTVWGVKLGESSLPKVPYFPRSS